MGSSSVPGHTKGSGFDLREQGINCGEGAGMMLPGVDPLLGICLVLLGASRFWGTAQGRTWSLGTLHGDSSKYGVPQGSRGAVLCPWLTWVLPKTRQNPWRAAPRAEPVLSPVPLSREQLLQILPKSLSRLSAPLRLAPCTLKV